MKLSELSPVEQGQLAVCAAEILTHGMTAVADVDALALILSAVRDNVLMYSAAIKRKAAEQAAAKT